LKVAMLIFEMPEFIYIARSEPLNQFVLWCATGSKFQAKAVTVIVVVTGNPSRQNAQIIRDVSNEYTPV